MEDFCIMHIWEVEIELKAAVYSRKDWFGLIRSVFHCTKFAAIKYKSLKPMAWYHQGNVECLSSLIWAANLRDIRYAYIYTKQMRDLGIEDEQAVCPKISSGCCFTRSRSLRDDSMVLTRPYQW